MHPNAFLTTFWQMELRPEVFVAMTFSEDYRARFEGVIAPAIRSVSIGGVPLQPRRVDESKSGDSILTEIMDGIAHSQMVLADVSTLGKDAKSRRPYRNGNVMYEVGIALACRQPQEVLLIRDDRDAFLFDVSTIPHMTIDFANVGAARARLAAELVARLNERKLVHDARVRNAVGSLSGLEVRKLREIANYAPTTVWGPRDDGRIHLYEMATIPRLLDKQLIRVAGQFEEGNLAYQITQLGREVVGLVKSGLTTYKADPLPDDEPTAEPIEASPQNDEVPLPGEAGDAELDPET